MVSTRASQYDSVGKVYILQNRPLLDKHSGLGNTEALDRHQWWFNSITYANFADKPPPSQIIFHKSHKHWMGFMIIYSHQAFIISRLFHSNLGFVYSHSS